MKKIAAISIIAMVMTSFGVMAQQTNQQQSGQGVQQNQQQTQEHFSDRKQKITQRIQDRINKMQEHLTCVQNAQDPKSLRACFPKKGAQGQSSGHNEADDGQDE